MTDLNIIVGGRIEDDAVAFVDAWRHAERGDHVRERTLLFESWDALTKVMTGARYHLLKHVHAHPESSVSALARSLGRHYRRVHADVIALEAAGLVTRREGSIQAAADDISAAIRL